MSKEMVSPTDVTTEAARIIDLRPIIRERDLRSKKSNQGDIRVVSRVSDSRGCNYLRPVPFYPRRGGGESCRKLLVAKGAPRCAR